MTINLNPNISPWDQIPHVWETESQYFVWVRGELRRLWANNPLRIEFLAQSVRLVTKEEKKCKKFHAQTKRVGECVFCNQWFPKSRLEVDHIIQAGNCTSIGGAQEFMLRMACVNFSELQLACVPCHKIKSHADRKGISFFAARVDKDWIKFEKDNNAKRQKEILAARLFSPEELKNPELREKAYKKVRIADLAMEGVYED